MTKSELIARLAERFPQLVAKDADFAVKMILDAMSEALVRGDRIEIRGFGSFALNYRPPPCPPQTIPGRFCALPPMFFRRPHLGKIANDQPIPKRNRNAAAV